MVILYNESWQAYPPVETIGCSKNTSVTLAQLVSTNGAWCNYTELAFEVWEYSMGWGEGGGGQGLQLASDTEWLTQSCMSMPTEHILPRK